jgi:transposase
MVIKSMRLDLENLPSDTALLHQLVRDMAGVVSARNDEIERLQAIIKKLQRMQFGRRSERLDPDQLALGLEDLDADVGAVEERIEHTAPVRSERPRRMALPEHLPREEVLLDIDGGADSACDSCGGSVHSIGESVSEMLDWVPATLKVIRITRPKYACRACGTVSQVAAPERAIAGGLATPALLAQVLVAKYCDHLPLYRQSQMFARHGVKLARSTLAGWVGGACWWLEALHENLSKELFKSRYLFADDTPVPVLDPGRGKTKTGRLWVYARDERPWGGPAPPAALFMFAPDRRAERPVAHLKDFAGVVHVDGYAGFERLTAGGNIVLAACWAHTRRKFHDVEQATGSPVAGETLRRIADIYAVEAKARGQTPEQRLHWRRTLSAPAVKALKVWLEGQLAQIPQTSGLADAIRYALGRWKGLTRFLEDGHIEMDTNAVERAIRPVALGRKNHLFAGSDGGGHRWAVIASLIETAKLNNVEPYAWLNDVLTRMIEGHPATRLNELMPWKWAANHRLAA